MTCSFLKFPLTKPNLKSAALPCCWVPPSFTEKFCGFNETFTYCPQHCVWHMLNMQFLCTITASFFWNCKDGCSHLSMGSAQFLHDVYRNSSCFVCHSFATLGIPSSALLLPSFVYLGVLYKLQCYTSYAIVSRIYKSHLCEITAFQKSIKTLCHGIQIVSYLFFSVYAKCSSMHANEMHLNQEFNYKCLIVTYRWDNCLSILIYKPFWDTVSNHNPDFDCILLNQDFWIWLSYKSLYPWFERLSWLPTNGCYRR